MTRTRKILSAPGAAALLASSIVARLPLAMFSIALLVHAQRLSGSFAVAGVVSAAYAISSAAAAPVLGGLVDRRGQTRVLLAGAALSAGSLIVAGLLPRGAPSFLLVALAAASGASAPPLDACIRTLLPSIVQDRDELPALFAFESTALELTFIIGPPLALGVGALWSTGAALCLSGLVMLGGTVLFASQPASRRWRPVPGLGRRRGGALRSPSVATLALVMLAIGVAFGATDVGVTAAAHGMASTAAAAPLLGLWGLGSLIGGLAATRLGGSARSRRGLTILLGALAVTHGALILTTDSALAMAVVITLAGATIAPTVSSIYAMLDEAAPTGTSTEAYSWLVTAELAGAALGAAVAGPLVQKSGAASAFAVVGAAAACAVLIACMRARSLSRGASGAGARGREKGAVAPGQVDHALLEAGGLMVRGAPAVIP